MQSFAYLASLRERNYRKPLWNCACVNVLYSLEVNSYKTDMLQALSWLHVLSLTGLSCGFSSFKIKTRDIEPLGNETRNRGLTPGQLLHSVC